MIAFSSNCRLIVPDISSILDELSQGHPAHINGGGQFFECEHYGVNDCRRYQYENYMPKTLKGRNAGISTRHESIQLDSTVSVVYSCWKRKPTVSDAHAAAKKHYRQAA